ncbi:hypothetical protein MWU54_03745 [Marivita sp. S6314]|uniref:hypothetical protein n=1 Tax=Marivita sp. S6314 TaxID=2926406 RepID=UPI001FF28DB8|nr:hypothetical protein [Marivita sp. S6314]MCK0149122.1 hypothetical protein [Marivita sp. S6314]
MSEFLSFLAISNYGRFTLASKSITLGEALSGKLGRKPGRTTVARFWFSLMKLLGFGLLACTLALFVVVFLRQPALEMVPVLILFTALIIYWWRVNRRVRESKQHFLLSNDRQGFMHDLRLDEKTVVLDGSNIYHLGHDNGLDAQPLGEIAHRLRSQGYRVVCFFDANIFYTLGEHGAFPNGERHSPAMLEDIFGLNEDEIYVVPSGVQADKYILECLKHMPISFAVTNDKFRDYADQYPTVMKDSLWRKGLVISGDEIKLLQHRFSDRNED